MGVRKPMDSSSSWGRDRRRASNSLGGKKVDIWMFLSTSVTMETVEVSICNLLGGTGTGKTEMS
ncbi:hypothetical protein EI94DRAFT_1762914 [Lactarius quietus]|nr:hypothetical protein EI94DRAFT_1762914 [Lactarius quietus]